MKTSYFIYAGITLAVIALFYFFTPKNREQLTTNQILEDLDQHAINVANNQLWFLDKVQNYTISVVNTKSTDDFLFVVVEINSKTKVENKELKLSGLMKLNYEYLGKNWYLLGIDNISLKISQ